MEFGGLRAVDGMDLAVRRGTLTAIIGPNGAGKTTLFNLLAGAYRPTTGRVELLGEDVTRLPAYARARRGLARTFQITRSLQRMTVLENLLLAPGPQVGERLVAPLFLAPRVAREAEAVRAKADAALRLFELESLKDEYAGALSGGQRKLLELARALMADPRVVLLDEPMAGVNPTLARRLLDMLERVRAERDVTFVLVEHDLETVFARCDPIVVMAHGRKLAEGTAEEIRADPEVVEAYLGGSA
ncbi:MAG TPA: ABC transporter ATP-binding protein [Candidatus Thermoplasmatota archaeon]|nr:ABC transporter ATP-binding protein [Candidatus Thermoplasmatota archaeon]